MPLVDASAVLADDGSLTVFALNRSSMNSAELSLDLRSFGELRLMEHLVLHHDDNKATNTEAEPNTVIPSIQRDEIVDQKNPIISLPALSWNVLRFSGK